MYSKKFVLVCFLCLGISIQAQNKFTNDLLLKVIYQHQYDQNTTMLLPYLDNMEEKYRLAACLAFASVQDTLAIGPLMRVYKTDKSISVVKASIYSLGQLRSNKVSKLLILEYNIVKSKSLKNEILMAIGKGANLSDTVFFDHIKIKNSDSALQYAFSYAVFQAYRRKPNSVGIQKKVIQILTVNKNMEIQKMCNGYFPVQKMQIANIDNMPKRQVIMDSIAFAGSLKKSKELSNPYLLIEDLEKFTIRGEQLYAIAMDTKMALVVRTWCMENYLKMHSNLALNEYKILLESGNLAFVSLACEKMRNDSNWINVSKSEIGYLRSIQNSMVMPRDFESWVDIEKTIAEAEGRTYTYSSWFNTGYKNPIDWEYVKRIPENQKVKITTTKGVIILVCKVNDAPSSVANFLKLVDSAYYDGKYFHRVVPDFVVQGGCPRGDGWGALNWVQRSEFSNFLTYKPGSIGLASAGKDSEGVQFFITHTWTHHLDGRYTIFAELEEGMEVVNSIQIGDRILKIERI